jgi:hypothetical protein
VRFELEEITSQTGERLSTAPEEMDVLSPVEWAPGPLFALLESEEVEV